jgi:predicted RNA-binding protein with RPS1 domain
MNDHDSTLEPLSEAEHAHGHDHESPSEAPHGAPSAHAVSEVAVADDPADSPTDGPADAHGDDAGAGSSGNAVTPHAAAADVPAGEQTDGPADAHGDDVDATSETLTPHHAEATAHAETVPSADVPPVEPVVEVHARPVVAEIAEHAAATAAETNAADATTPSGDGTADGPADAHGDSADGADAVSTDETPEESKGPRPPKARSDAELAALRRRAQESWQRVVAAKDDGSTIEGTVIAAVKGGALVDMAGVRGFLPASQVRAPEGGTLEALVKTKLSLKILDTDAGRRRAVVSNRKALEEERRNKRSELIASLKVGERREGTVVRLADFGAFVDLGGVDGLIPMSELAQERVEKVGDVLKVGEKLTVEVLRVDEGGKKISLSRKNALPDPWRDHAASLRVGSVVKGTVVGFEPRFTVEIAPGIVGTIRDSDADPTEYSIGEAIEVRVRNVDRRTRRITLVPSFGDDVPAPDPMPRANSNGFAPLGVELQRALEKARRAAESAN